MSAFVNGSGLSPKLEALVQEWYAQAELFTEHECQDVAATYRIAGDELERNLREWEDELLNLQQASEESGYSADHIGRLLRRGTLPNAGRLHAPRIRRADLPQKTGLPSQRTNMQSPGASKEQIARSIGQGGEA